MNRSSRRRKRQKEKRRKAKAPVIASDILQEPENEAADLKLIASQARWSKFNDDAKGEVTERLMELIRKKSTTVLGKDGEPVEVQDEADRNAINAAKVLQLQEAQMQKDDQLKLKLEAARNRKPAPVLTFAQQITIQKESAEQTDEYRTIARDLGITWPPTTEDMELIEAEHRKSRLDRILARLQEPGTLDHNDSEVRVIGQPEDE